jgi:hypothetical protein
VLYVVVVFVGGLLRARRRTLFIHKKHPIWFVWQIRNG